MRDCRLPLCAALCGVLHTGACAADPVEREDFADAVRVTALRVRAGNPDVTVRVLNRRPAAGGATDEPLGWDARQALTTAGFELVEDAEVRAAGQAVLVFRRAAVHDDAWELATELRRRAPRGPVAAGLQWTVTCPAGACTVVDSVHSAPGNGPPAPPGTGS